jgi:regulator of sigma E protease
MNVIAFPLVQLSLLAALEPAPWVAGFLYKVIPFVIVLGLLIFFHELGHFLAAKAFGVRVVTFSFGFGPRLLGLKMGETDYRVSAIPLGGYVKMTGEGLDEELTAEDQQVSFSHKALWKRMLIVFCGPFSNFIFAVLVFFLVFLLLGQMILTNEIGEVKPNYPAYKAGLRPGDTIIQVAGRTIRNWKELPEVIKQNPNRAIPVIFERGKQRYRTEVTPISSPVKNIFGEEVRETVIGISPSGKFITREQGPLEALGDAVVQTWTISKMTVLSVVKLIQQKVPLDTLGGPILIAQLAGQQAQEGWTNLLFFAALLSVNLGILNLLPIPILDGGHLLFFGIEGVMRRPLSLKKRELAQQIGMALLILLMVFVFYNDIIRLLQP